MEEQVERVTPDARRRLHLLLQQLEGEPYTLVKGCQLIPDAEMAYARAKAKLIEQYGHPIRQALAFKSRLMSWPSIKKDSPKELRAFSIQLQHCEDVKQVPGLEDLDAPGTLYQLMSKLPERQQQAWRLKAYDIETAHMKRADYRDFVSFVKRLADAANHPTFGIAGHADDRGASRTAQASVRTTTTAHESTDPPADVADVLRTNVDREETTEARPDAFRAPCLFCQGPHPTARCESNALSRSVKLERLRGLCFGCLKPGHQARQCKHRLKCSKCQGLHPTILHEDAAADRGSGEQARLTVTDNEPAASGESERQIETRLPVRATAASASSVVVATVPIRVWKAGSGPIVVRAILDSASSATFITNDLAAQLEAQHDADSKTSLQVSTLTGTQSLGTTVLPGLKIASLADEDQIDLPPVYTVSCLPFGRKEEPTKAGLAQWRHLRKVPLDWTEAPVAMLIGINVPDAMLPDKIVRGGPGAPYAFQTKLGWCVNGPMASVPSSATHALSHATQVTISEQLQNLYYHDFQDAYGFVTKGYSQDDHRWLNLARNSILRVSSKKPDGTIKWQYQLPLPFRDPARISLQDNKVQALRQLQTLRRKFESNSKFFKDYKAFITKMQEGGFVEPVPSEVENEQNSCVSYVPHHGVYHPRKPDKIRVVFNCANKFHGVSLNDCLLSGPDLTSSLIGVLLRFRQGLVPFMADIESMFYQVLVPPNQRDVLRYLWWPDNDPSSPPQSFRLKVHLFGAASSPSCANFALRRAAEDAPGVSSGARSTIRNNFYVDDCLKSVDSEEDAISLAKEVVFACAYGGFRLTKFVSPSLAFLRALLQTELAKDLQAVDLRGDKGDPLGSLNERALGVAWCVTTDEFVFRLPEQQGEEDAGPPSKRQILSKLSAIYDPLGMAAPVIIQASILFRRLTKMADLGWDDPINQDKEHEWRKWIEHMPKLKNISLPRCFRTRQFENDSWKLHVFCDASMDAYAAVAYLRQESFGRVLVSFVLGKARVSQPKVVTIPRLELTAAKLATELAYLASNELQIPIRNRTFWTDSQTVLKYLQNQSKRFHTFVANRLAAILAASTVNEWKYVPTSSNPADCASRGLPAALLPRSPWLQGPNFLSQAQSTWPATSSIDVNDVTDLEVKVRAQCVEEHGNEEDPCFVEQLAQRYSKAWRFRRALSFWLRLKGTLRGSPKRGPITVEELNEAETSAISWLQHSIWSKEIKLLQGQKPIPRSSLLHKLSPEWEPSSQIIVMRTRTRRTLPIIPRSRMAELFVEEAHVCQAHLGRQSTQAEAARHRWIIGLNQYARQTTKGCAACQRRHARPMSTTMAALPEIRLASQDSRPFEHTGVDYFGPFYARRGRAKVKVYGVVFTCAVSRAVHLEVAESLRSESFLYALRRFICRRGHVRLLVSDNGTNFVGANSKLTNELELEVQNLRDNEAHLQAALRKRGIQWSFSPPGASHHGGFWERMIQSVRRIFEALLSEETTKPLTIEALTTFLCEAEAVLNSRPLTPVSTDADDFEALTPNHLLMGSEGPTAPPGEFSQDYPLADRLRHQWKHVQHLATQFWRRWCQEYKTLLHRRTKWHQPVNRQLCVDDVVLIADQMRPREQWRLGRVHAVHKNSEDGRVRVADIRTSTGIVTKPITKLCLLETASAKN